jgi:hypothetical protein
MSAEIIPFPTGRQPSGQPRAQAPGHPVQRGAAEAAEIEPGGNVALFVLTETGAATAWVSEEVQTTEHWDYVLDFLRQVETALVRLRAERGG